MRPTQFNVITDDKWFTDIWLGKWLARVASYPYTADHLVYVVYGIKPNELKWEYESVDISSMKEAKEHAMKWLLENYQDEENKTGIL